MKKKLLNKIMDIRLAELGQTENFYNQGQGMDGLSALANYQGIADEILDWYNWIEKKENKEKLVTMYAKHTLKFCGLNLTNELDSYLIDFNSPDSARFTNDSDEPFNVSTRPNGDRGSYHYHLDDLFTSSLNKKPLQFQGNTFVAKIDLHEKYTGEQITKKYKTYEIVFEDKFVCRFEDETGDRLYLSTAPYGLLGRMLYHINDVFYNNNMFVAKSTKFDLRPKRVLTENKEYEVFFHNDGIHSYVIDDSDIQLLIQTTPDENEQYCENHISNLFKAK